VLVEGRADDEQIDVYPEERPVGGVGGEQREEGM
jgi:hypothetical protein